MIKGIRRGVISLICALLLVVPFSFTIYADEQHDDIGYYNAQAFFANYGMTRHETIGHTLSCTNNASGQSCTITSQTINNPTYWFNTMVVAAGTSFKRYSAYDSTNRQRLTPDPTYIVFLSNTNFTSNSLTAYPVSGTVSVTRITNDRLTVNSPNNLYLIVLKAVANQSGTTNTTIDIAGATAATYIVPIYYGTEEFMSDDIHRLVFGDSQLYITSDPITHNYLSVLNDRVSLSNDKLDIVHNDLSNVKTLIVTTNTKLDNLHSDLSIINNGLWGISDKITTSNNLLNAIATYLSTGNNASNSAGTDIDNKTSDLTNVTSTLNNFESSLNTDLTTQMNNINFNTSGSIISNNNFLLSSNWVRTQYNRMITNNPFGSMISFSLVIGISLLVIGKLRK